MAAKKSAARSRKTTRTRKPRRKFATMKCPIKGCTHWLADKPGTVPGVKRHVRALHADVNFDRIKWPATYDKPSGKSIASAIRKGTSPKREELEDLSIGELRERAKAKGIKTSGLRKGELVSALS